MEDIQIWSIDGSQAVRLTSAAQTTSEKLLEQVLVNTPDLLSPDLTLIGRQTPTEGGPLDLLGIDGDGRLVVFELKRGTLSRDAVAQVIDYASDLDRMNLDTLSNHISQKSGSHSIEKIENFQDWYINDLGFEDLESLKPLRLFLVGLGVDKTTERMVKFLAENSGMDISLLTFHGFTLDGKTILAKQVEVDGSEVPTPVPPPKSLGREERLELLTKRSEELGVGETFSGIRHLFMNNWKKGSEGIRRDFSYMLLERVWYARLAPESGVVRMAFYPWTINMCSEAFSQIEREIRSETHRSKYRDKYNRDELHLLITPDVWESSSEKLATLTQTIYSAWQKSHSRGKDVTAEHVSGRNPQQSP